MPITSVQSEEEALNLIVLYGKRRYDGQGYIWPGFEGTIEALHRASQIIEGR